MSLHTITSLQRYHMSIIVHEIIWRCYTCIPRVVYLYIHTPSFTLPWPLPRSPDNPPPPSSLTSAGQTILPWQQMTWKSSRYGVPLSNSARTIPVCSCLFLPTERRKKTPHTPTFRWYTVQTNHSTEPQPIHCHNSHPYTKKTENTTPTHTDVQASKYLY